MSPGSYTLHPLTPESFSVPLTVSHGKTYTLGRSNSCDLVLRDARISRRQCQLFVDPNTHALVLFCGVSDGSDDQMLGKRKRGSIGRSSSSFLFVDGEKISAGDFRILNTGCKVRMAISERKMEIGFVVNDGHRCSDVSQRRSLKEVDVNKMNLVDESPVDLDCNGQAKRVKASVDKIIRQSRVLRSEMHAQSLVRSYRTYGLQLEEDTEEKEERKNEVRVVELVEKRQELVVENLEKRDIVKRNVKNHDFIRKNEIGEAEVVSCVSEKGHNASPNRKDVLRHVKKLVVENHDREISAVVDVLMDKEAERSAENRDSSRMYDTSTSNGVRKPSEGSSSRKQEAAIQQKDVRAENNGSSGFRCKQAKKNVHAPIKDHDSGRKRVSPKQMDGKSDIHARKLLVENRDSKMSSGAVCEEHHDASASMMKDKAGAPLQEDRKESSGFCCNLLEDMEPLKSEVSLMEMFSPIDELEEVFMATFTSDILWFISSAKLAKTIPITIACHDNERSWSTSVTDRTEHPYPEWPNLKLVFPPFPVLRRTKDKSKMLGVGCHHPKLMLLRRRDSIRVVITSANLNYRQWFQVSNTVWWQDFPLQETKNYNSLFNLKHMDSKLTTGDFAAELAAFISSLVKDVPTEAHWAISLANYDFSRATGSLVASVPGFHEEPLLRSQECMPQQYLGTFASSVVGIYYNYHARADPNGARLRKLAAIVGSLVRDADGMVPVTLRRANLPADSNAVAVYAVPKPEQDEIHIGFLPKRAAQWVACLWDEGICRFNANLWPKQVLSVAAGQSKVTVELVLDVLEGPSFQELPAKTLSVEQLAALSNLLRHMRRKYGIWRLEDVLSTHRWPDAAETDFVYCSSSLGTSLNPKFVAAFSAAAGRKAVPEDEYESDPEWGCWTSEHEKRKPSIKLLFPTIERVKKSKLGPSSYRGILCFAEKTWARIASTTVLYDAVPHPASREGFPMHVKVACRSFKSSASQQRFGWIYTGSHNFSPAAWGKSVNKSGTEDELGRKPYKRLHICNYELGIVFMDPPGNHRQSRIDELCLPFVTPPPMYNSSDRPATGRAIFNLVQEMGQTEERSVVNEFAEMDSEIPSELELELQDSEEDDAASSAYVEQLIPEYNV